MRRRTASRFLLLLTKGAVCGIMTATKEVIMTGEKKASAVRYHRRALLEAADRLLTEFGYDGMNMNMLAKEANYSKATVYVYFESKDEIVRALCIERLKLMRRELALVLKSDADTDGSGQCAGADHGAARA